VSITNAAIGALVCILLFLTALRLGYYQGIAFLLTVAFAFSTFFIVYATKSLWVQRRGWSQRPCRGQNLLRTWTELCLHSRL
jgi:hypothetical protein